MKLKKKKINRKKRGAKVEKIAFDFLKNKNFLVWKPPKVKFQSQDILGYFDLIAINKKSLKLIQVQRERKRNYKVKNILKLPKPKNLSYELWVYDIKKKKFNVIKLK